MVFYQPIFTKAEKCDSVEAGKRKPKQKKDQNFKGQIASYEGPCVGDLSSQTNTLASHRDFRLSVAPL